MERHAILYNGNMARPLPERRVGPRWRRAAAARLVSGVAGVTGILLMTYLASAVPARAQDDSAAAVRRGGTLFQQKCAACHGMEGKGDGPIARSMRTPPPDFTKGAFRHGASDEQMHRTIALGIPGTMMAGWKGRLSDADIFAVIAYVRSLKRP